MAKKRATKEAKDKAAAPPAGKPALRLEWIEAGQLAENPRNWRRHPDSQMGALRDVLADPEIGWAGACLFNERTGRLIDGHARRNAVDPKTRVPVLVGNWSEDAEKKILLSLDPLAGLALPDADVFKALAAEVEFSSEYLQTLMAGLEQSMTPVDGGQIEINEATDARSNNNDAADTMVIVGPHRLTIERDRFLAWYEELRQAIGFDKQAVEAVFYSTWYDWTADQGSVVALRKPITACSDPTYTYKPRRRVTVTKPDPMHVQRRPERNRPCPCGSGRKFKRCCGKP